MNQPVIVLDVDGVIFQTPADAVTRANALHGTSHAVQDIFNHHAEHDKAKFVMNGEDQFHAHQHIVDDYSLVPGCVDALRELSQDATIIALTSRNFDAFSAGTHQAIKRYLPGLISEVHFTTAPGEAHHHETKGQIIKRLGGSVLVDDAVKHCESARVEGVPAILFGQPYNASGHDYPAEWRAKDWPDVVRIVRERILNP